MNLLKLKHQMNKKSQLFTKMKTRELALMMISQPRIYPHIKKRLKQRRLKPFPNLMNRMHMFCSTQNLIQKSCTITSSKDKLKKERKELSPKTKKLLGRIEEVCGINPFSFFLCLLQNCSIRKD